MEIFAFWVVFAIVVGVAANTRGRSGGGWFFLALIISPLLAGLFVLALPRVRDQEPPIARTKTKACPFCAEQIQRAAIVCRHCGRDLHEKVSAPTTAKTAAKIDRPVAGAVAAGDGSYNFQVVGEASYQRELEQIAGSRTHDGARHECVALLIPEPANPYDANAVYVRIDGRKVGYLSRDQAPIFRTALLAGGYAMAACYALIVGGWYRGPEDQGHYGVRLDLVAPFSLQSAPEPPTGVAQTLKAAPRSRKLVMWGAAVAVAAVVCGIWILSLPTERRALEQLSSPAAEVSKAFGVTPVVDVPMPRPRPNLPR